MIRVLVVDDHAVVRAGLEQLLDGAEGIELVGTAAGGAEAIEVCRRERPDVVLMDLSMPELDGVAATRRICSEQPESRVVVLTSFSDRDADPRRARRRRDRLPAQGRRAGRAARGHPRRGARRVAAGPEGRAGS